MGQRLRRSRFYSEQMPDRTPPETPTVGVTKAVRGTALVVEEEAAEEARQEAREAAPRVEANTQSVLGVQTAQPRMSPRRTGLNG